MAEQRADDIGLGRTMLNRRDFLRAGAAAGMGVVLAGHGAEAASSRVRSGAASSISGTITLRADAGQRWELPERAEIPLFKKKFPNVQVNIVAIPHGEAVTKLQIEMTTHTNRYDVVFADDGQMTALARLGAMTDLQPYLDRDPAWRDDYFADLGRRVSGLYRVPQNTGTVYALTPDGNSQVCFYRQDIFAKLGFKDPSMWTWTDAIHAAQELTSAKANQYGFITTMQRGIFAGFQLWAVMASYGGSWFDKEAKGGWHPQFHSDAGMHALTTLKKLMPYAHPVTLNATDNEANQALANGSAVYAPIEWGTSTLADPKYTKYSHVIAGTVTPRGETPKGNHRPLMGGLGLFIPTWSQNKDAAWEWIKFVCSGNKTDPAIGKTWVLNTGQPARVSLLKEYSNIRPIFKAFAQTLPVAVNYVSPIPEAYTIATLMGNETTAFLAGEKSADAALKAIDAGTTQIMQKGGYYG